jgi:hypothetical protein
VGQGTKNVKDASNVSPNWKPRSLEPLAIQVLRLFGPYISLELIYLIFFVSPWLLVKKSITSF